MEECLLDVTRKVERLLENTENREAIFYDMFYSTVPKDVSFESIGADGKATMIKIPNLKKIIQETSANKARSWRYDIRGNTDVSWITAANMFGDSGITLPRINIGCSRMGSLAVIDGRLDVGGFSQSLPSNTLWQVFLEIARLARQENWFTNIVKTTYGTGYAKFFNSAGADTHYNATVAFAKAKDEGSTPNTICVAQSDTVANENLIADTVTIVFAITCEVED